jgi:hypothetical protein
MKVVVTCGAAENLNRGWFDKLMAQVDVKLQQLSERYQINDYEQLTDKNIVAVIYDLNDLSTVLNALAINGDIS